MFYDSAIDMEELIQRLYTPTWRCSMPENFSDDELIRKLKKRSYRVMKNKEKASGKNKGSKEGK